MNEKSDARKSDDRATATAGGKPLADVRLDAELMNALVASQGRDERNLAELKSRHDRLVINQLRSHNLRGFEADEVACIVWEQVWKMGCKGTWNAARARHTSDPFVPLLKRICKSRAMDFHRRTTRERRRQDRLFDAARSYGDDWQEALGGSRGQAAVAERPAPAGVPPHLAAAVAGLPERLRCVYELHSRGRSVRSISPEVGCSPGEVSRRLMAAREQLGLPRKAPRR